jgi:hypothetical protein
MLMEIKMVFYQIIVTNAVNLSQPSVFASEAVFMHQFIYLSQTFGLDRSIFQRLDNGIPTCCKVRSRVRRAGAVHKASYRIAKNEDAKRSP